MGWAALAVAEGPEAALSAVQERSAAVLEEAEEGEDSAGAGLT